MSEQWMETLEKIEWMKLIKWSYEFFLLVFIWCTIVNMPQYFWEFVVLFLFNFFLFLSMSHYRKIITKILYYKFEKIEDRLNSAFELARDVQVFVQSATNKNLDNDKIFTDLGKRGLYKFKHYNKNYFHCVPFSKNLNANSKVILRYGNNKTQEITQMPGIPYLFSPNELDATEIEFINLTTNEHTVFTGNQKPTFV